MGHFGENLIKSYPALLEDEIWIDGEGRRILIEEMSDIHKERVLKYLESDQRGYPFRKYFENGLSYNKSLNISKKVFDEMRETYELLVRKINELEK